MLEKLKLARSFIEQGWTQYYYATNANGALTDPMSQDATCWEPVERLRAASSSTTSSLIPCEWL